MNLGKEEGTWKIAVEVQRKPGAIFAIMRIIEWKTLLLSIWADFGAACSVDRMIVKIGAQSLYCALLFGLVLCCPLKMTV